VEQTQLDGLVETWRERLTSVSWFMRCLNEQIARKANEEDDCTGHFWEGRFKSQALLDESAVLACLAYVDLNPVRAAIAKTPEDSDYTSAQRRIRTLQAASESSADAENDESDIAPAPTQPPELYPFVGGTREGGPEGLPFHLVDYLELVNWTGRAVREDKRGAAPSPRICRRSWSASASPKRPGWSWPRTSRPPSAPGSVKPSMSSGLASEMVNAGRAASARAGGCFPADCPQLSP